MPERMVDLVFRMLRQNEGKLSMHAQDKEFDKLAPEEIAAIEWLYEESFGAANFLVPPGSLIVRGSTLLPRKNSLLHPQNTLFRPQGICQLSGGNYESNSLFLASK